MTKRIPNWYDWHWQNNPPVDEERKASLDVAISIILRKAVVLEIIGRYNDCLNIIEIALSLAKQSDNILLLCSLKCKKAIS